ncbi:MAG: SRPBCC family protein [Caulobacterales bacterium]|nr:SRPBCC family protein [Caulobacterales bacterium]
MSSQATVAVTLPSDREVAITRAFAAPRGLVFDAFTKPELMMRWMWGPDDWPLIRVEIDLKAGGALRYEWRHAEKGDMGLSGVFQEIAPPERLVHTELFDEDWTGGETVVTTLFEERDGRTTVSIMVRYASREARDAALNTGVTDGMAQSYDRLDAALAAQSA